MISLFLSVCATFCPYNTESITSIEVKFGGQVFHGVQMDSSEFGVIFHWKLKSGESFSYFQLGIYNEVCFSS